MSLLMRISSAALGGNRVCRTLAPRQPKLLAGLCSPFSARSLSVQARAGGKGKQPVPAPPPPAPEDQYDEAEEGFDYDPIEDLTAAERRRVLAMKEVQKKYDALQVNYLRELAQLQAKYTASYAPLFDERKEIYTGKKPVDKFDVEDDGEPDKGVEDFWLNALSNHNKIGTFITERDAEVLKFLEDIRSEVLTGDDLGFKLYFHFKENPFFSNTVLEKTYILEPEDDVVPKKFIGSAISWKSPSKDVTTEEQKKRVKAPKGEKKGDKPAFVIERVPCDSFFTIFDPPKVPTDEDAAKMADDELEEVEEALSNDFEIGYSIRDQVIPRAVEWFTGEIAPLEPEDYDDEFEEGDFQ